MVKKKGLFIILAFVFLFSIVNLFLFFNKTETSYASISGMYLKEFPELPMGADFSLVAFILQWVIFIIIIIFTFASYVKHKKIESTRLSYDQVRKRKAKAVTDLDTLYNILKEKKVLNVRAIAKLFNITKEKALEWAKILENHDLVRIEYPAFSSPEVKINEKEDEKQPTEQEGKEKETGKKAKLPSPAISTQSDERKKKKQEGGKPKEKLKEPTPPKKPKPGKAKPIPKKKRKK